VYKVPYESLIVSSEIKNKNAKALLRESKGEITRIKRRNNAKKRRSNAKKGEVMRIKAL
jgi:hypothetical protein